MTPGRSKTFVFCFFQTPVPAFYQWGHRRGHHQAVGGRVSALYKDQQAAEPTTRCSPAAAEKLPVRPAATMSRTTCILTLCLALLGLPALQASVIVNAKTPMRLAAVEEFTWSPCDDLPHPGEIESLSISPDPIPIPGQVIASGVAKTSVPLESPMKLSIIIEKEILGLWVKVPCVDNYGSCTYDLCDILDDLFQVGQSCPEPLHTYGVPCHCPILQGTYSVPSSIINIPSLSLPSWLENGHYRLKGTLTIDGAEVGCAKMDASLKSETGSWWK